MALEWHIMGPLSSVSAFQSHHFSCFWSTPSPPRASSRKTYLRINLHVWLHVCVGAGGEGESLSPLCLFATLWTIAHQAPLSMGFPKQEYWSGLPFPPPRHLCNPGIKLVSPALSGRFFTSIMLSFTACALDYSEIQHQDIHRAVPQTQQASGPWPQLILFFSSSLCTCLPPSTRPPFKCHSSVTPI